MSKDFHVSMDKILYQDVRQSGRFFWRIAAEIESRKMGEYRQDVTRRFWNARK